MTYSDDALQWVIETDKGEVTADFFVAASGCLSARNVPPFKGLDTFEGSWYHTSAWPSGGVDLTGKRVGIIGTGSTGIQAIPMIVEQADHLYVFQRTANYSLPSANKPMDAEFEREWKKSYADHRQAARESAAGVDLPRGPYSNRSALSVSQEERDTIFEAAWGKFTALLSSFNDILTNPEANELVAEFVRSKIRQTVKDQEVAELLSPRDFPIGTKRICIDTNYYETYNRDNVTLVDVKTHPIDEITPTGLRTTSGSYDVDVLVFATGFDAMTGPLFRMDIRGKEGRELKEKWAAGPRTYLGLMTAGFPNMFMITGPGSPSVLTNMTTAIEQHVDWIASAIGRIRSGGLGAMEPNVDAEDAWVDHVNKLAQQTLHHRANSWYLGANIPGKPRVFMPYVGGFGRYREQCEEIVRNEYQGFAFGE